MTEKILPLGLNDPETYRRGNEGQRRDNQKCLADHINKFSWKGGDTVLDIGSGDGSVTAEVLRSCLPRDFKTLIGSDRNDKMVEYANKTYADDKLSFEVLEIGEKLPEKLIGRFDHVFSFYALNWVRDQRVAYRQIYDLLTEDGDCLLQFVGHHAFYSVYRLLANCPKWSALIDIDKVVGPFHDYFFPEERVTKLMRDAGFRVVDVECTDTDRHCENKEHLRDAIKAVNILNIPEEDFDEYFEEFLKISLFNGITERDGSYCIKFRRIVVFARK